MNVGERIKLRREELNMSQDELAKKVGYTSRSSIAKLETNANGMKQSKIIKFAEALETTPSYLMGWTDNPEPDSDLTQKNNSQYYRSIISENLKKIRHDKQLTIHEVAEGMGISEIVYANIERGSCNAALSTLILMANYFNISLDSLISRNTEYNSNCSNQEKILLKKYRMLSSSGKDRANGYIEDLLKVSEYRKTASTFKERTAAFGTSFTPSPPEDIRIVAQEQNSGDAIIIEDDEIYHT